MRNTKNRRDSIFQAGVRLAVPFAAIAFLSAAIASGEVDRDHAARFSRPTTVQQAAIGSPGSGDDVAAAASSPSLSPSPIRLRVGTFDPLQEIAPTRGILRTQGGYGLTAARTHYYLVQLDGPVTPERRQAVLEAGAEIVGYVPDNTYLVRGPATLLSLRGTPFRWVGQLEPEYKVDPQVLSTAAISRHRPETETIELRVWTFAGEDIAATVRLLSEQRLRGEHVRTEIGRIFNGRETPSVARFRVPTATLEAFLEAAANDEAVYFVEEAYENYLHNENSYRIHQNEVDAAAATSATVWLQGLLGEGQIYSANDSGLDIGTCYAKHSSGTSYTSNTCGAGGAPPAEFCQEKAPIGVSAQALSVNAANRKVIAYNLPNVNSYPNQGGVGSVRWDSAGHGTGTTSCAVGDNYATLPVESPLTLGHDTYDGVAPLAKVVFQDIGGTSASAVYPNDNLYGLLAQSFEAGAGVNNNSWGGGTNAYGLDAALIDHVLWDYSDRLATWSSGNSGTGSGTLGAQSNSKNAIIVGGSHGDFSGRDSVYTSSSSGPTGDGRIKPDILASGQAVETPYISDNDVTDTDCGTASSVDGTSFSAPIAAGHALLVREYFMKGYYPSGTRGGSPNIAPSGALVKGVLINGARNMSGSNAVNDAPSDQQGWGRLHLEDALYFSGDSRRLKVWDVSEAEGVATGDVWERKIGVAAGQMLKFTLNWYDPPAAVQASTMLVDDLDLEVVGPTGTVYRGNQLTNGNGFPGGGTGIGATDRESAPNPAAWDRANNVEQVWLIAPTAGTWTVRVRGYNVPGWGSEPGIPRQPFALVATGNLSGNQGILWFDQPLFQCGDAATVSLYDENGSSPSVTITSANGDSETVALSGSAPSFTGSLPIVFNAAIVTGDGTLQVGPFETLTVSYNDPDVGSPITATASVECHGEFAFVKAEMSGGCDADAFLDAGETGTLAVTFRNPRLASYTGVTATLESNDPEVFVHLPGTAAIGSLGPGADGVASFAISGHGLTFGTASMTLWVTANGLQSPQRIDFDLRVETDLLVTPGSWSNGFENPFAEVNCDTPDGTYDGTQWYNVYGSACNSWTQAFQRTSDAACRTAGTYGIKTFACGAFYGQGQYYRILSPEIVTGPAGSWTELVSLTFKNRVEFGRNCEYPANGTQLLLYLDPDSYHFYYQTNYGTGSTGVHFNSLIDDIVDFSSWAMEHDPAFSNSDFLSLNLWFDMYTETKPSGPPCNPVDTGWNMDELVLTWTNYQYAADATASCSSCTTPPDPTLTVTNPSANQVDLSWTASAGADHYVIYRAGDGVTDATCGSTFSIVARVSGATSWSDTVSAGKAYAYKVAASDASEGCLSAAADCKLVTPTGSCLLSPAAVTGLAVVDNPSAGNCRLSLSWSASAAGCAGGTVRYNIYRSTDASFVPGESNLLVANLNALGYDDVSVESGYVSGLPSGTRYSYVVRAIDTANAQEEGNVTVVSARPSGNAGAPGTWTDDGGDTAANLTGEAVCSDRPVVSWTPSTAQAQAGSSSYRSVQASRANDTDCSGGGPTGGGSGTGCTADGNCSRLVTPELVATVDPRVNFWIQHDLEAGWDGVVVEVNDCLPDCPTGTWTEISGSEFTAGGYTGSFASTVVDDGTCPGCGDLNAPFGTVYIDNCDYPPTQFAYSGSLATWTQQSINLPASYDNKTFQIGWHFSSDCAYDTIGAYIDTISITNVLLFSDCAPTCEAPTFYGVFSATDVSPTAGDGVTVSWPAVSSWGGGAAGSYEVYRDGLLVGTVAAGTTTFLDNPPDNVEVVYSVRALNSCGAFDDNTQYRAATDASTGSTSGPPPVPDGQFVAGTPMTVAKSGANADLTWDASSCPAGDYNVYWGSLGTFDTITGGSCNLGTTGAASGVAVPSGTFFLIVGSNDVDTIGSFGRTSAGAERPEAGWSGVCVETVNDTAGTCP